MSDTIAKEISTLEQTDRKCPNCGGIMTFDPATGDMGCPYCDNHEEIKYAPGESQVAKEMDFNKADMAENCNWGVETKSVVCKSCGAESVYDALEIAAVCPFCGSNHVMEASDVKTMAPNGVVPFSVTSKKAAELFKNWIQHKWFCPAEAKKSAQPDRFKGAYLPYWTFDADTSSKYTAEYGIDKKVKVDDKEEIKTDWYPTSGNYAHKVDDELVCATNVHDEYMLRAIEPYETNNCKAYKPEYVAGFAAERYVIGIKDAWEKAKNAIKRKLENLISDHISDEKNADHVRNLKITTEYLHITYKYLLLPVWTSSYMYNGKVYQFVVNGQTGKVYGKTPISAFKVILTIAIVAAIIAVLVYFMG